MIDRFRHFRGGAGVMLSGAFLVLLSLSACGGEEEASPKGTPAKQGQTVARVNGQEITEHELEAELKLLGPLKPEEQAAMTREVLRRMVQRAVLAQKAVEKNLHRTPEVMMDLRRSRAQILAKAYLSDGLARQLPVSGYDIEDFIDGHPHYFADRRHYIFDQLLIENGQVTDQVMEVIQDLMTLDEVEETLTDLHVPFSRRLNANLGSQFPKDTVAKIDALESGEIFLTETKDYMVISKLVESRLQPVNGNDAHDLAKRLLVARRDAGASRQIIDDLLSTSNVEFLGGFADMHLFTGDSPANEPAENEESGSERTGKNEPKGKRSSAGKKRLRTKSRRIAR